MAPTDDALPASDAVGDLSAEDQEIVDAAQAWIDDEADLEDEQRDSLAFTDLATGPAVSNVTFAQVIDDHPVMDAELVVHVLEDGSVQGATNTLTDAEPTDVDDPIDQEEAEENAGKATDGTPDEVGPSELTWVLLGDDLTLAWAVNVTATDPDGSYVVEVDAESGDVIDVTGAMADRAVTSLHAPWSARRVAAEIFPASARLQEDADACDPGPAPSACVFLPDPIYANGGDPPDVERRQRRAHGRAPRGPGRLVGPPGRRVRRHRGGRDHHRVPRGDRRHLGRRPGPARPRVRHDLLLDRPGPPGHGAPRLR